MFTFIDLCSGAGGLSLGLTQAGLQPILHVELEKDPVQTLRINKPNWNVIHSDFIKQHEYRIHVGKLPNGETSIISIQRKARREGFENPNWQVRNHNNGFVFVRGGVNPPQQVLDASTLALTATGLDFGAVDVIWNERTTGLRP